jgi:predicted phage-related endonuclease
MEILDLVPGTDAWLCARLNHKTASEAAAMMGDSKYMTRNQLLALKKGWQNNPNDDFKEELFRKGHEFEALAREHIEDQECEDFPAVVGSIEIDGLLLLASFDGLSNAAKKRTKSLIWEHKSPNSALMENTRNGTLTGEHYWQLEHQMVVAGTEEVLFTVSDGTVSKKVDYLYQSVPKRRKDFIAGWKQFDIDLDDYVLEARPEKIESKPVDNFPIVEFGITGTAIDSNIEKCLELVRDRAQQEMSVILESDEDFARKETLNKTVKTARADLKAIVSNVLTKFGSLDAFNKFAGDYDSVLQKMQSHGEKQVLEAKQAKKDQIVKSAVKKIDALTDIINEEVSPINFNGLLSVSPDFYGVMKGKRDISKLQDAVDQEVSRVMIIINALRDTVVTNLASMRKLATNHKFLFTDMSELIIKDNEALIAIVKLRISDYKAEQNKKAEALVEKARIEVAIMVIFNRGLKTNGLTAKEINDRHADLQNTVINEDTFGDSVVLAKATLDEALKNLEQAYRDITATKEFVAEEVDPVEVKTVEPQASYTAPVDNLSGPSDLIDQGIVERSTSQKPFNSLEDARQERADGYPQIAVRDAPRLATQLRMWCFDNKVSDSGIHDLVTILINHGHDDLRTNDVTN